MKTKTALSKITSILLAFVLVVGFAPTMQVHAATPTVTIDLGTVTTSDAGYDYDPVTGIITVTSSHADATATVHIMGNGSAGYSIVIEAAKNITIADTTTIKGAADTTGIIVPADATITGEGSGISITGGGDMFGGTGIYSTGAVTISGSVGNITGGAGASSGGNGILVTGAVTISGSVGNITGSGNGNGIYSTGAVTISGKTGVIKSGGTSRDIYSDSYSILNYKAIEILDPLNCRPTGGHTVSFDYGTGVTWADDAAPQMTYTSPNGKIPAFPAPAKDGRTVLGWYKDANFTTPWVFATDTVSANITIFAEWSSAPTIPQSFTATAGVGEATLSWAAPASDGGSAITGCQVSKDNGTTWVSATTATSHTFTGLTAGTAYTFSVRAVNAVGNSPEATDSATPLGTAPTITTTVLPNGQVGVAYSQTLTATGTAPIVWTIDSGSLPAGLALSSAGVISGTPTAAESSNFTVKAANGVAPDTTKALTIVVDPAGTLPIAPTITINTHPAAETTVTAGSISGSLSVSATASDGSTPTYQWFNFPANTAVAGVTSASFPIPTGLAAGSYSYYCIASSGGASATSNAAKVVVVPPVVATTTPAVTSANPINLDLNGSNTGFVTITLGASGASGNVLAGQADVTVSSGAVTATPAVLTADGNVTITAQSVGTATVSVAFSGKDITDTSYDETITVNVTDSNKPVTPVNPPTTSGGSSSGSGGGSSRADGAHPTTTTTTNRPLTKAEATKLFETALAAKPASATTLSIKVQNKTSVTKEVLAELAALAKKNGVTLTVHFDNVVGGKVVSRLSVNPATATADLDLNITENKALAAKFAKFYSNPLAAFTVKAGGSVAIKLPANLKPEGLVIYSYDAATNTYAVIPNAKPWVDKNGYLHFELPAGTEVVISQGNLVKK